MIIRVQEIDELPTNYNFRLLRKDLKRLEQQISFDWMECRAKLTKNREAISIAGDYAVILLTNCNLCLIPARINLNQKFKLSLIAAEDQLEPEGDVEFSLKDSDCDHYHGQEINLAGYFEDQLLLDLPLTIKCSEECKGLCTNCGTNLNLDQCKCQERSSSNPFSVLKDLIS